MKKLVVVLMLVAFAATVAYAADSVTYPAVKKKGEAVTFNHKGHQAKLDCAACHEGEPAKIAVEGTGKKNAHALCLDCHKTNEIAKAAKAPTSCKKCHMK